MAASLAMVAPGTPLRDGLERVLHAERGALVVIGDGPEVLSICTGGFLLDAEFSPQRLSELAKMDGAIIVSSDASRIARANVHLMPSANVPTAETGTRHRTAERVARSIDVPVVSVSAAMNLITVYRHAESHVLQRVGRVMDRATQGLQSLERFRERFDAALVGLTALEVEDTVTIRDVVAVLQPAEQLVRIAEDTAGRLVELGADGQLLRLQLEELTEGVAEVRALVVQDYLCCGAWPWPPNMTLHARLEGALDALAQLSFEDCSSPQDVGRASVFCLATRILTPRSSRTGTDSSQAATPPTNAHRPPRRSFLEPPEHHAGVGAELEKVGGVGEARARSVKEGLARLAETSILDRYNA